MESKLFCWNNKNVNLEFYVQRNHSSKVKEKERFTHININWGNPSPALQETLKDFLTQKENDVGPRLVSTFKKKKRKSIGEGINEGKENMFYS